MTMQTTRTTLALAVLAFATALHAPAAAAQSDGMQSDSVQQDSMQQDSMQSEGMQSDDQQAHPIPTAPRAAGVPDPAVPHPELAGVFKDFGGEPGLTALMDDFMVVLLDDPRMQPFFANVDQVRVKRQLVEQFCVILDGGCTYTGRDMVATHAALGIDRANFNALVEDLQVAMNGRNIPFRSQNKLVAILAPMHREIINR